jgi:hypothetical protein
MYRIWFRDEEFNQRVCEFLYTYSVLSSKNPEEFLLSTDSRYDFVKVPLSGRKGKTLLLPIADFLALRNLYMEEMHQLRLEDMLFRSEISLSGASLV